MTGQRQHTATRQPERQKETGNCGYHSDTRNIRNENYCISLENESAAESQGSQKRTGRTAKVYEHVDSKRHQTNTKSTTDRFKRPVAPKPILDMINERQDHVDSYRSQDECIKGRSPDNYDDDHHTVQVEPRTRLHQKRTYEID